MGRRTAYNRRGRCAPRKYAPAAGTGNTPNATFAGFHESHNLDVRCRSLPLLTEMADGFGAPHTDCVLLRALTVVTLRRTSTFSCAFSMRCAVPRRLSDARPFVPWGPFVPSDKRRITLRRRRPPEPRRGGQNLDVGKANEMSGTHGKFRHAKRVPRAPKERPALAATTLTVLCTRRLRSFPRVAHSCTLRRTSTFSCAFSVRCAVPGRFAPTRSVERTLSRNGDVPISSSV